MKLSQEAYQTIMLSLEYAEKLAKKENKAKVKYFKEARQEVEGIGTY